MNALGIELFWCSLQVTLLAVVAAACYLLARRASPITGVIVPLAGLTLVTGLTFVALSPWPRWHLPIWQDELRTMSQPATVPAAESPSTVNEIGAAGERVPARAAQGQTTFAQDFWSAFQAEILHTSPIEPARRPWWPTLLASAIAISTVIGLIRLLAGLLAVRQVRLASRPIADVELQELLVRLQAEAKYRGPVELRESAELVTAATIGWRRPLILLPLQWRSWTAVQQRLVLAHELAHICQHDYLTGICAQLSLVLHFYHPLIHWLVGRLRLEQELAADAAAAALAGGHRTYLMTLAEMALAQAERPVGWPARSFLPTRRTFLRRIEMLRDMKRLPPPHAPLSQRALVGLLVGAAIVLTGLRLPHDAAPSQALAAQAGSAQIALPEAELTYFTAEGGYVVLLRPAALLVELAEKGELAPLARDWFNQTLGLPPEQLDLMVVNSSDEPLRGSRTLEGLDRLLLRSTQEIDWKPLLERLRRSGLSGAALVDSPTSDARRASGKTYYVLGDIAWFQPDDRTIVLDRPEQIERYLAGQAGDKRLLEGEAWQKVADAHVAIAIDPALLRRQLAPIDLSGRPTAGGALAAQLAPFAPLWQDTQALFAGVTWADRLQVEAYAVATNAEVTERLEQTSQAAITLAANFVRQVEQDLRPSQREDRENLVPLLNVANALLKGTEIQTDATTVSVTTSLDQNEIPIGQIAMALNAARSAARRTAAMNNLKQIALAMHNFHAVHGRLPRAAETQDFTRGGAEAKHPHSWRVTLLPYLDREDLYRQYHFDEPWYSEHNLTLLEQMPPVFRHPSAPEDATTSSFFVLTGPHTMFPDEAMEFSRVVDGVSYTLLAVEAKRDIPWTKPEDIPYDPQQPLPDLGGYGEAGFLAALGDGSVRFISAAADQELIRKLITATGQEPVRFPN